MAGCITLTASSVPWRAQLRDWTWKYMKMDRKIMTSIYCVYIQIKSIKGYQIIRYIQRVRMLLVHKKNTQEPNWSRGSAQINPGIPGLYQPQVPELPSLKLTANAPENRPKPNRKHSYSNHPFSGAFAVSFREGIHCKNGPLSIICCDCHLPTRPWKWMISMSGENKTTKIPTQFCFCWVVPPPSNKSTPGLLYF